MAQNLNYAGSAQEGVIGSCIESTADYGKLYARKYRRAEAMRTDIPLCPCGWHIPNDAELNQLVQFVGGSGHQLKSQDGWTSLGAHSGGGPDSLGFRVLPSGAYSEAGYFVAVPMNSAGIWSSSGKDIYFNFALNDLEVHWSVDGLYQSIRCLED